MEVLLYCDVNAAIKLARTLTEPPEGLAVAEEVLTSHVRSIDTLARPIAFTGGAVPAAVLAEVRGKLAAIMGM